MKYMHKYQYYTSLNQGFFNGKKMAARPERDRPVIRGFWIAFSAVFTAILPGIFLAVSIGLSVNAFAHGVGYTIIEDAETVTVECLFSDGEPMQYAEVTLFSPEDGSIEYQNGRTDRQGRFAFFPRASGVWRMEVTDGMGHAVHAKIQVALQDSVESGNAGAPANSAPPNQSLKGGTPFRAVLGISLIMNIFFGVFLWKQKRKQ